MSNWDTYIQETSQLLETKSNYYRRMGQIALEIEEQMGRKGIEDFTQEIKETTGQSISANSLHNYAWIYKKVKDLEIPDDATFTVIQLIASSTNPFKWSKKMIDEGLSSQEMTKLIKEELGRKRPDKLIKCPFCQKTFTK